MPRGPNGEKRPRDTIGCAVTVMKIATGEIEEDVPKNRDGKVNGGKARAEWNDGSRSGQTLAQAGGPKFGGHGKPRGVLLNCK